MSTIIERSAATAAAVAPATRFRRRAMAAAAVLGGLLTVAGFAATVWETAPDKLAYLGLALALPGAPAVPGLLVLPLGAGAPGARVGRDVVPADRRAAGDHAGRTAGPLHGAGRSHRPADDDEEWVSGVRGAGR